LQQQATELEMRALRAQMNPHFIFNCLNAINGFILVNESETAADYLTKFSRLIRMVLNNSQKKFISLEEELETLQLYLYMESLRFQNNFLYRIHCDDTIDALSVFIPPLLFQPFIENAIWHGLMHKEGIGELLIDLHCEDNILHCTIRDNGIGRKKAAMLRSKSAAKNKSMGMQITKNRMALLNQDLNGENYFEIHDIEDAAGNAAGNAAGTLVSLKIKVKEMTEENTLQNRW
jgi:LytS/YehU family sensor histidine kinase